MMWRRGKEGGIEFLVISYQEAGIPSMLKFPGGTNRTSKKPLRFRKESPEETLAREWEDEVGQTLQGAGINPVTFHLPGGHTKYFFLLDEEDVKGGELRIEEKVDREEGRPDEILSAPQWFSVDFLRREMRGHHSMALEKAVQQVKGILKSRAKRSQD